MQGITVTRSELLQLLGGQRPTSELRISMRHGLARPRGDSLQLVYPDSLDLLDRVPPVIVTDSRAFDDTLAWLSTYIGDLQPVSAFMRIVEWDSWLECTEPADVRSPTMPTESLVAALVIAEALTHWRDQVDVATMTTAVSNSTYSFARARLGVCLPSISSRMRSELPARWTAARSLLDNPTHAVTAEQIERVWTAADQGNSLYDRPKSYSPVLSEAVRQVIEGGVLHLDTIDRMVGSQISGLLKEDELRGSRERRIGVFSRCCDFCLTLSDIVRRRPETSLVLAYVASRMSVGTFEYIRAVCARLEEFPEIVLWYGLFEGLAPESRVHNAYGGVGTRLFRDVIVQRSVISRPVCDISLEELAVLVKSDGFSRSRLSRQGSLQVELLPLVESTVRVAVPKEKGSQPENQREFSWSQSGLPKQVVDALEVLRRSIAAVLGTSSGSSSVRERQRKSKANRSRKDR